MEQVFENDDSPPAERQEAARKTTLVSVVVNVLLSTVQVLVGGTHRSFIFQNRTQQLTGIDLAQKSLGLKTARQLP